LAQAISLDTQENMPFQWYSSESNTNAVAVNTVDLDWHIHLSEFTADNQPIESDGLSMYRGLGYHVVDQQNDSLGF
jgi:hypothetical protein